MRNFWNKVLTERWNLHFTIAFALGALLLLFFAVTGLDDSLRWYEITLLFGVIGVVFGLAFEIFQVYAGEHHIERLRLLYDLNILSRYKTDVSIPDAIATGAGFLLSTPVYYLAYIFLNIIF